MFVVKVVENGTFGNVSIVEVDELASFYYLHRSTTRLIWCPSGDVSVPRWKTGLLKSYERGQFS